MDILYEIKEIPEKGFGIFAMQKIPKQTIIWSSKNDSNIITISDNQIEKSKSTSKYKKKSENLFSLDKIDILACYLT